MKKLKIYFWKVIGVVWDLRPRLHLPKYSDYPIACCDVESHDGSKKYHYPPGIKVLFEWDEKGKHWIVFTR